MPTLNRYCKAYPIERLRKFPQWPQNLESSGGNGEEQRNFLYLHDSLIVTRDIFANEQIVFDQITAEWKKFCEEELKFSVPAELNDSPHGQPVAG